MSDKPLSDDEAREWALLGDPEKDIRAPVLDLLNDAKVFAIQRTEGGAFNFYERCDEWHGKTLTREQVLALADELRALAA